MYIDDLKIDVTNAGYAPPDGVPDTNIDKEKVTMLLTHKKLTILTYNFIYYAKKYLLFAFYKIVYKIISELLT
jgi:hypothetical protein